MSFFEKLNKAWQEGINKAIDDVDGGERPEVAAAWRESEAESLLECEIDKVPDENDGEAWGTGYTIFREGWDAALNRLLLKDREAAISSWIRAHGELTDYSDLEGNDYEVYIVKKSDLKQ